MIAFVPLNQGTGTSRCLGLKQTSSNCTAGTTQEVNAISKVVSNLLNLEVSLKYYLISRDELWHVWILVQTYVGKGARNLLEQSSVARIQGACIMCGYRADNALAIYDWLSWGSASWQAF